MAVRISTGLPNCREGRQNLIGSVSGRGWSAARAWRKNRLSRALAERVPRHRPARLPRATAATEPLRHDRHHVLCSSGHQPHPDHPQHDCAAARAAAAEPNSPRCLFRGRVTLGIGLGGSAEEYRRLHGELDKPNRGQMMDEYLQALRCSGLIGTPRSGKYVGITDAEAFPKPLQDPLPIFVAGNGEAMLRRAAASQGWIEFGLQPDDMRSTIAQLREYREEAGRQDEPFEIARQFYISTAPTEDEAKANRRRTASC